MTSAVAASTIPTQARATPTRNRRAPVRYPPEATRARRACRASASASVAGISPPRKNPVSAATRPSANTARALVDATGSGSSGCRAFSSCSAAGIRDIRPPYKGEAPATNVAGASTVLLAEGSQIEIIQRYRVPARRSEPVVRLGVAGHRVHLLLGLLGRLDPDVAVLADAGTSRDELADDHVLLEADQRVAARVDRRVGQYPGGLLEGRRRQPRLGGQRRLGDTHEHRTAGGRLATLGDHAAVLRLEVRPVDEQARQELRGPRVDDRDPLEHLPDDDLDVLVVDLHTLRPVDLLDLLGQVDLHRPWPAYPQQLVPVDGALGCLLADLDVVAVGHPQPDALGDLVVHDLVAAVVGHNDDLPSPVAVLDAHPAAHLGDGRLALGYPRLEDLLDTRQTLGDVLTRAATGVQGTHRQLRTRLTDRLDGDDADHLD